MKYGKYFVDVVLDVDKYLFVPILKVISKITGIKCSKIHIINNLGIFRSD